LTPNDAAKNGCGESLQFHAFFAAQRSMQQGGRRDTHRMLALKVVQEALYLIPQYRRALAEKPFA